MAYISQDKKKTIAPAIKKICKKYGVKCGISVDNHSSLVVTLKSGSIDFDQFVKSSKEHPRQVNVYWIDDHWTGKAQSLFNELIVAMKGPDYFDHSNSQTDYFHCSHYININIGRWDRPYILEEV
jgi:hypothetical protein